MTVAKGVAIKGLARELNLDSYGELRIGSDVLKAVEYGETAPRKHRELCERQVAAVKLIEGGYDGADR